MGINRLREGNLKSYRAATKSELEANPPERLIISDESILKETLSPPTRPGYTRPRPEYVYKPIRNGRYSVTAQYFIENI